MLKGFFLQKNEEPELKFFLETTRRHKKRHDAETLKRSRLSFSPENLFGAADEKNEKCLEKISDCR